LTKSNIFNFTSLKLVVNLGKLVLYQYHDTINFSKKMRLKNVYIAVTTTALVLFVTALSVVAQNTAGFQTPTGNIYCLAQENKELRCDIQINSAKLPPKPKDCNLEWGNAFGMDLNGKSERFCHGDTIFNPKYPVLGYGKTWRNQGFTCVSKKSGVTCTNKKKHGWQISKTNQTLF
jgi:hypothetical protein